MCVGVPVEVLSVDGVAATCRDHRGEEQLIDLSLVDPVEPGAHLLTFLGSAREIIDADRAAQIAKALSGLEALMRGEDPEDPFADLNDGPTLPPHLAAAAARGQRFG